MSDRSPGRRAGELIAAAVVVAAVVVFARRVGTTLSMTVLAALFGQGALVALVVAATGRYREGLVFLFAVLAIAAVGLAAATHPLGAVGTIAAVAATLVVMALGVYAVEERRYKLRRREAIAAGLVVAVAAGALVATDLGTSPLDYETDVADSATVPEDPSESTSVVVGSATVENDFVYREPVSFPSAGACVFNGTARTDAGVLYGVDGSYFPSNVGGGQQLRANMTLLLPPDVVASLNRTVPVERADTCPAESDRERIVVVVDE